MSDTLRQLGIKQGYVPAKCTMDGQLLWWLMNTKGEGRKRGMNKMGFCVFTDGCCATDVVAPKSNYPTIESFLKTAEIEAYDDWADKIKAENVREGHCRYYPTAPEGCDIEGGCYSFSGEGRGAFPVWYINIR